MLIRFYMYERFLERLSNSDYKDKFIVKGGFYLSTLFGLENRTTMDIDVAIKNEILDKENLTRIIEDIINIDLNDKIIIKIESVENIRQEDEYGGYRFTLVCHLDNIREQFHFDIATGDPITPKEIRYNYKLMLSDKKIKLWSYNLETILAEKLETIMSRNVLGSRMKDYYDVYLIMKYMDIKIDLNTLKKALYNTFSKRGSLNCFAHPNVNLENIKFDKSMKIKWLAYQRRNKYANNIDLEDIIDMIEELLIICEIGNLQPV